ncbi:MAG: hypothetical protein ACFFB3_09540, partial [Candidatus Hodarchaeota archaeon]
MKVQDICIGCIWGPFLLLVLSLQASWSFYCANIVSCPSVDHDRVESRITQPEKSFLLPKDCQIKGNLQKGSP